MLACNDVTIFRENSESPVLQEFRASFFSGNTTALIGENGSGKTTLALLLAGILPRIISGRWSGDVTFNEVRMTKTGWPSVVRATYAPAEAGVELLLGTSDELLSTSPSEIRSIADTLPLGDRRHVIRHLSAGQRRLMGWLLAAARRPNVLIIDEAFASLDRETGKRLTASIRGLPWARQMITVLTAPSLDQTVGCDATIILPKTRPKSVTPTVIEIDQRFPVLEIAEAESVIAWWSSDPNRRFRVGDLHLRRGEIVRVRGQIGAGKTTVLKAIGAFPGTKGDRSLLVLRKRARPTYCGGEMYFTTGYPSLAKLLDANLSPALRDRVWSLLEGKLRPATLATDPATLSTGQRHLLSIVLLLIADHSPVICLDEPERGLDTDARAIVAAVVALRHRNNSAVLIATHDDSMIEQISTATCKQIRESQVESV